MSVSVDISLNLILDNVSRSRLVLVKEESKIAMGMESALGIKQLAKLSVLVILASLMTETISVELVKISSSIGQIVESDQLCLKNPIFIAGDFLILLSSTFMIDQVLKILLRVMGKTLVI